MKTLTLTLLTLFTLRGTLMAQQNIKDAQGNTPIMRAVLNNNLAEVKHLAEEGADLNIQNNIGDNPLLYAGASGLTEITRFLVRAGASTKIYNRYGGTALIPAAEKGHLATVRVLLEESNVDVNHVNNLGWTALMEAVVLSSGAKVHQDIISLLLKYKADPNIPDKSGVTALTHAKQKGFSAIVRILEQGGAK